MGALFTVVGLRGDDLAPSRKQTNGSKVRKTGVVPRRRQGAKWLPMNSSKEQRALILAASKRQSLISTFKSWIGSLALAVGLVATDAWARKVALLDVSQGQQPTDTHGRIGGLAVDLTATPAGAANPATSAAAKRPDSDPARLKRIRSAKMPLITQPVLFNTPQADAILAALEVFPPDNPWNVLVTDWPVHPDSKAMVTSVGRDKPLRCNPDMSFVLVPPDQKRVEVRIVGYPGESDSGPFPVPDNTPIEGWPVSYQRDRTRRDLSLEDVQRNNLNEDADRHALVVDPVNRMLYEFYQMKKTTAGWQAAQSSLFDLKSNALRPAGWTSSDAAGLPVFPAVVRYDELKRGTVEHALRVTVRKTRRAFVAPATHYASPHTDPSLPRMGERFRLRQDFDVSGFSPDVRIILTALKRYGTFVADNGIEWAISITPDERIPALHEELRRVKGADLEVVIPPP